MKISLKRLEPSSISLTTNTVFCTFFFSLEPRWPRKNRSLRGRSCCASAMVELRWVAAPWMIRIFILLLSSINWVMLNLYVCWKACSMVHFSKVVLFLWWFFAALKRVPISTSKCKGQKIKNILEPCITYSYTANYAFVNSLLRYFSSRAKWATLHPSSCLPRPDTGEATLALNHVKPIM